jgi:pyruvate kinase
MRRTKIVATLGPGSSSPEVIEDMIRAGVDVFRLNFSHGTHEEQRHRNELIRACSEKAGRIVGVLADLQGPKIRTGRFVDGRVQLIRGERFILDADLGEDEGTNERVGITYKDLPGSSLKLLKSRVMKSTVPLDIPVNCLTIRGLTSKVEGCLHRH